MPRIIHWIRFRRSSAKNLRLTSVIDANVIDFHCCGQMFGSTSLGAAPRSSDRDVKQ